MDALFQETSRVQQNAVYRYLARFGQAFLERYIIKSLNRCIIKLFNDRSPRWNGGRSSATPATLYSWRLAELAPPVALPAGITDPGYSLLTHHRSLSFQRGVGRARGVGRGLGVALGGVVGDGVAVGVGVGVGVPPGVLKA
jgi:hypothetical protein